MTFETDNRLKSFLDTNQLARERMCRAILSIDRRFTNVRPRHPRGGPDGGRDIEATYRGEQEAFGAVGFLNQANDSPQNKSEIKSKFRDDLSSALAANQSLKCFVFFTNVNLTLGEKQELIDHAITQGIGFCEIFDRERMVGILNSPDGLAIRYQILSISLSDAEQATFFARWGDDIQGLIADGFGRLERSLNRALFLLESDKFLTHLTVVIKLDRSYRGEEIGHFRLFCSLHIPELSGNRIGFLFGATDDPHRHNASVIEDLDPAVAGLHQGRCGGTWQITVGNNDEGSEDVEGEEQYVRRSFYYGVGHATASTIGISLHQENFPFRENPYLRLEDIDEARIVLFANRSLSEKILSVAFYANEYFLGEIAADAFYIDAPNVPVDIPMVFSPAELNDPWVRIMGLGGFHISFSDTTPRRLAYPEDIDHRQDA